MPNNTINSQEVKMTRKMATAIMQSQIKAYRSANKKSRGIILTNLESVLHRPRKSIIRSMNVLLGYNQKNLRKRRKTSRRVPIELSYKKRGRPKKYSAEADAALAFVWEAHNYICAELLYPVIKEDVKIFIRDRDWHYSRKATRELEMMSLGSMKRRLVAFAHERGLVRGFSTTRAGCAMDLVPIFHGNWKEIGIGYGQIDTVVHSGPKLMGQMAYTVNYVDMKTYWTEQVAQLGKRAETTRDSIAIIDKRLPFRLTGLHPDSGDEFINDALIKWVKEKNRNRKHQIELTRSRPSKKNDNCNVEERNNNIVRKYLGYERYDCKEAVEVMNELYEVLRLYTNFFQPTFKLVRKYRTQSGRWIREYDVARTPFMRILEDESVPMAVKNSLMAQYNVLNPRRLLDRIKTLTVKLGQVQRKNGYNLYPN